MSQTWTDTVHREVLPNGLRLLVQRDPSAPAAAVVTHVEAGFFDEPDQWVGISHVLEHMFFKGTRRRGVGDIARETKAAGGYLNAGTGYDHTSYYVVLPADRLETALDIQSDALRHSVVDEGELARELQVIIQEARRKKDSPAAVTWETLHEVMYDRHRIRRWRIGTEEELSRLTREDVWGYYTSRYVPSRTIVAIVGDIDVAAAVRLAHEAYGDWSAEAGVIAPSPGEPARDGVHVRTLRGDIVGAQLALGWRGVPPLHPDAPALDLVAAVLGLGRGSWLYQGLRTTGLVTSVGCHHYTPTELGVFSITAETEPERIPAVLTGIAEGVSRLAMSGPRPGDMERARALLLTRWARQLESMDGRASALASAEALQDVAYLDRAYEALGRVTAEEVREAALRYLDPGTISAVVHLPEGRGDDLTVEAVERALAVVALPVVTDQVPRPPETVVSRSVRSSMKSGVLHAELPAADLLVRQKAGVPLVTMGFYRRRLLADPPAKAGLAALAARAAVRGAAGRDAAELAFAFERLGGALGTSAAADWTGFAVTVRSDRMAEAASLLAAVEATPEYRDEDVARERSLLVEEARQVENDMVRYPLLLGFRAAFGDQGYGLPVHGLPDTLMGIGVEDLRDWHRSSRAARPVLVAVGDLEPGQMMETLAGVVADLPETPASEGGLAQTMGMTGVLQDVKERARAQTALAMIFPGPSRRAADRHTAEVLSAIASGLGGRLFEALRDRRSLAYTVLASSWQRGGAGAFLTYIAMAPSREAEARDAMLAELDRFIREPVEEKELERAVEYLAGQALVSRQSGSAVLGEILEAWLIGTGLRDLQDPAAGYRSVTRGDVQRVAGEILGDGRRAEGVVRGTDGRTGGQADPPTD